MVMIKFCHRVLLTVLLFSGYGSLVAAGGRVHVIPEPVSVTEKPGSFNLRQGATLSVAGDSTAGITAWLVGQVRDQTGIMLHEDKGIKGAIVVQVSKGYKGKGSDGYNLSVSS